MKKSQRPGSNRGPADYKSAALPAELRWLINYRRLRKQYETNCQVFTYPGTKELPHTFRFQRTPWGVSSRTIPCASKSSRILSDSAKSFALRAC